MKGNNLSTKPKICSLNNELKNLEKLQEKNPTPIRDIKIQKIVEEIKRLSAKDAERSSRKF